MATDMPPKWVRSGADANSQLDICKLVMLHDGMPASHSHTTSSLTAIYCLQALWHEQLSTVEFGVHTTAYLDVYTACRPAAAACNQPEHCWNRTLAGLATLAAGRINELLN
jgi:hypothetical protein